MAKPTHDEIIRELTKEVAILNVRLNNVHEELRELKRGLEEASKKRWALLPPVVGAVVSALLAALVAYVISRK